MMEDSAAVKEEVLRRDRNVEQQDGQQDAQDARVAPSLDHAKFAQGEA